MRGEVHQWNHALVIHARGADDADRAEHRLARGVGAGDYTDVALRGKLAFGADENLHFARALHSVEQRQQLVLLVQGLEERAHALHVFGELGRFEEGARAFDEHPLGR